MTRAANQSVEICNAVPGDAGDISALLAASFDAYRALYTAEAYRATVPDAEGVRLRMEEGPVFIASVEGKLAGTVSVVFRQRELYIRGMAVSPEFRGLRIGVGMIHAIEEMASAHHIHRLVLSTTPFLERAIKRYTGLGFVRVPGGPDSLHGTPLFTMVRELNPVEALVSTGSDRMMFRRAKPEDLPWVVNLEGENADWICRYTLSEHEALLSNSDCAHLIVMNRASNTPVGFMIICGLDTPDKAVEFRRLVIGDKGQGFGRETLQLVKAWCFEILGRHRLWLDVFSDNARAIRLYSSEGFKYEGELRETVNTEQGFRSLRIYSLLEEEFREKHNAS